MKHSNTCRLQRQKHPPFLKGLYSLVCISLVIKLNYIYSQPSPTTPSLFFSLPLHSSNRCIHSNFLLPLLSFLNVFFCCWRQSDHRKNRNDQFTCTMLYSAHWGRSVKMKMKRCLRISQGSLTLQCWMDEQDIIDRYKLDSFHAPV